MSNVFFISDLHFGHKKIMEYSPQFQEDFPSLEERDEHFVQVWNNRVRQKDTVWVLGDLAFGSDAYTRYVPRLMGDKRLVLGNHDNLRPDEYLRYFTKILGAKFWNRRAILTHIPVHENQFHRAPLNLHGHMHSAKINDPRYFNVSVEQLRSVNYAPISWDEIKERIN